MASTLGKHNPLRYCSYVYDEETKLYYLQSRYYNPEICRFISADAFVSTVQGILGYNMFAYCGNNPVMRVDRTGSLPSWNDIASVFTAVGNWVYNQIVQPVAGFFNAISEDFKNYNPNNTDKDNVFSANNFSNYNGIFVILTDFDASFSFGFICLSRLQLNEDILKHEYGHRLQLNNMGLISYIANVAIPSVTINILLTLEKLPYDYYTYPFEAEANQLAGANPKDPRNCPALPSGEYTSYWDLILLFFR